MKKSITILLLVIAITFAGMGIAAADPVDQYTLTITSGQNTVLQSINTTFGSMLAGNTREITPTFNLTNSGNTPTVVNAKFTTNITGNPNSFGMVNATTEFVPATSFSLESAVAGAYTGLTVDGIDALMADDVPVSSTENWNIRVIVPSGQTATAYTGTVELTFS